MKRLDQSALCQIVAGSTILGTGGGGRYDSAMSVIQRLPGIDLIAFEDLDRNDVVITAYGAGGLTKPKNTAAAMNKGLRLLQQRLGKPITAIVPVEIGPYSLAAAFEIAAKLQVPVVDGDLVGFRSVPEIFIELVTLAGLPRCPLVFGNNEGDLVLLEETSNAERLEQIIRSFADSSLSNTFVLGYPYAKKQLGKCLAKGSVSYCLEVQNNLETDFSFVAAGRVTKDVKEECDGFTRGFLQVQTDTGLYRVEFKNEYLVLLRDNQVVVTCPDLICLVDSTAGLGLNNGDDNTGKLVKLYVKPAIEQWRTTAGIKLFSPKSLALPYEQRVL